LKLLAAGYDEEVVLVWDRESLLSSYAEVLACGKAKTRPGVYDPEIEKERLAFEQRK